MVARAGTTRDARNLGEDGELGVAACRVIICRPDGCPNNTFLPFCRLCLKGSFATSEQFLESGVSAEVVPLGAVTELAHMYE